MTKKLIHGCEGFENLVATVGEKGISIVAAKEGERRSFYLEAIAFEPGELERLIASAKLQSGRMGIALAMRIPVAYCPCCGAQLESLIQSNLEEFDRLVAETSQRSPGWR